MFNNVAIDVVIGLVFVYLLYSLFATVLSEIIATWMGLRARNLKEAVNRMLTSEEVHGTLNRLVDSLKIMKDPDNDIITNFYKHPEIKQLGSSGIFKNPSSFKAESFSKTLLYLLNESGPLDKDRIDARLRSINSESKELAPEAARYILYLWDDSYGDLLKFKLHLEGWFDRSMEQATEWYKRKIQVVLLLLGFFLAWFFNADTFTIIEKLSKDKEARGQLVTMATAHITSSPRAMEGDSAPDRASSPLDSLILIQKSLQIDIVNTNSVLGIGAWPADTVRVSLDPFTKKKRYNPAIDPVALTREQSNISDGNIVFTGCGAKWTYFFGLFLPHFYGFLITAIAISLGAPFWFDLLNKLIHLRTSAKQSTRSTEPDADVSLLEREG